LTICLHADRLQIGHYLPLGLLARAQRLEVEVVQGDAPLEEAHQHEVVERLQHVDRVPLLVRVDAHDLVAQVAVLAADVGERVVLVVVRVPPRVGGRGGVPVPALGVDVGIVHPVPLAVHDVVADLHVLEDLGERQRGGPEQPQRAPARAEQQQARGEHELAVQPDRVADVARVALAEVGEDVVVKRVELAPQLLQLLGSQTREGTVWLGLGVGGLGSGLGVGEDGRGGRVGERG
jgi:hypothetical protein